MNATAYSGTTSTDKKVFTLQLITLCLGVSLVLSLVWGGGEVPRNLHGARDDSAAQFPAPPAFSPPTLEIAGPIETQDGDEAQDARLLPLRGAPAWVWDLPNDDPRKIAAGEDWSIVAANDRHLSSVVMDWGGGIVSNAKFWNGLCPRWVDDPQWGGVGR